jgi:hypothetical protein
LSEGRRGQNPNLKEDAAMKNVVFSYNDKGNGVNTKKNRCMGCMGNCETCPFKDAAERYTFENYKWERFEARCNEFEKSLEAGEFEEDELEKEKDKAPILCEPYIVTIAAIYHQHYHNKDDIIFRLDIDDTGKVIKKLWSPHGTNSDNRLDSLVFGYALHHLTPHYKGGLIVVNHSLELVLGEGFDPYDQQIIYQVGPNFMAKTIEVNPAAIAETVRKMESSRKRQVWFMAVYEIMVRNLLNDTEYFIGLPICDPPAREV